MRRVLIAIVAFLGLAIPALAGDYAERTIIGFSPDGAVFAFEEYGVEDGSGFPYANVYFVDTATDTWVPGTPIRVRIDNDTATLDAARQQAFELARPFLSRFQIGDPGRLLVRNPITELSADPRVVNFLSRAMSPLQTEGYRLTLSEATLDINSIGCPPEFGPYRGFDLTLRSPTGETRLLHDDNRIPQSRGCAVGYTISDVIVFDRANDMVLIVIVNLFKVGFEGPDRRYLAVATTIPY